MRTQKEIENKLAELRQGYASKLDDVLSKPPSTKKEKKQTSFRYSSSHKAFSLRQSSFNIKFF